MQRKGFDILRDSEDSWWYVGRSRIVSKIIERYYRPIGGYILDFGSGYGGMFGALSRFGEVSAFEPNDEARESSAGRGYAEIFSNVDEALTDSGRYSLIALFDVVEHIEDDKGFIERAYKNLSPGGRLVITVPAFMWLWSEHDVLHNHFRRYSEKEIRKLLEDRGFIIEYASYWNFFLFPLALIMRVLGKSGGSSLSSTFFLSRIFLSIIKFESMVMSILSLPFGTSVVVIARKA